MEYKFTTSAKKCSVCKKTYEELEYFYSILSFDEKTTENSTENKSTEQKKKEEFALELSRLDICQACWENSPHDTYFSWWRLQKAVKPRLPALKDADFLWQLFSQAQAVLKNTPSTDDSAQTQSDVKEIKSS